MSTEVGEAVVFASEAVLPLGAGKNMRAVDVNAMVTACPLTVGLTPNTVDWGFKQDPHRRAHHIPQ